MKIKWHFVYHPLGEWRNEAGQTVEICGNFQAVLNGEDVLVIMVSETSGGGHGESSISSRIPMSVTKMHLEERLLTAQWVEVAQSLCEVQDDN